MLLGWLWSKGGQKNNPFPDNNSLVTLPHAMINVLSVTNWATLALLPIIWPNNFLEMPSIGGDGTVHYLPSKGGDFFGKKCTHKLIHMVLEFGVQVMYLSYFVTLTCVFEVFLLSMSLMSWVVVSKIPCPFSQQNLSVREMSSPFVEMREYVRPHIEWLLGSPTRILIRVGGPLQGMEEVFYHVPLPHRKHQQKPRAINVVDGEGQWLCNANISHLIQLNGLDTSARKFWAFGMGHYSCKVALIWSPYHFIWENLHYTFHEKPQIL